MKSSKASQMMLGMLKQELEEEGTSLKELQQKWSTRAFKALDTEAKGFLYKDELLDHIKASGTYKSHQIRQVVEDLEARHHKDYIKLFQFDALVSGTNFLQRVLENNLVIRLYPTFTSSFN